MTSQSKLPPYMPFPRFLLETELTQTSKLLYALLLDRTTLSKANDWLDSDGRVYLVYPIQKLAETLGKSAMTVKNSLNELESVGFIERRRQGFSAPSHIYVKLPDGQKTVSDNKLALIKDRKLSL